VLLLPPPPELAAGCARAQASRSPGIAEPFGVDSYFLLTTQDPIDPAALTSEGVRSKGGTRGAPADPLSEMLSDLNTGKRGAKRVETPGAWSIESLTIRSMAKDR
jgi:hypothetical protein